MEQILYYTHYTLLLLFGITVSAAFSGISATKKNLVVLLRLAIIIGGLQIVAYCFFGEDTVWQLYPFITHLPIILTLRFLFGKHILNTVSATTSAYLCCQISRWFGLLVFAVTDNSLAELLIRIFMLLTTAGIILRLLADKIARIYSSKHASSWVFGIIPVVYYLFDYAVAIYSSLWTDNHQLVVEFLPFFLCIGHLVFCAVYYREYELKNEAEHKEQILRITVEQQTKEIEMIRRSEAEIRRLRHDINLFLNSLSSCIEASDQDTARKLITGFSSRAEASSIKRYCENDTLNYVLSDYAAQCRKRGISFVTVIELTEISADEMLFSTILTNALDNALKAQEGLPTRQQIIHLMIRNSRGKLLLCVKNSFKNPPLFQDGIPVTSQEGHGNGVQSIRYITEKLGGNCQFCLEQQFFVLRVVI